MSDDDKSISQSTAEPVAHALSPDKAASHPLRGIASSRELGAVETAHTEPLVAPNVEELASIAVDCAYKLHVEAGPGLLETVYEAALAQMLLDRGLHVRRQFPVRIYLMGLVFDEGFRADLLVEGRLLIELKSVEVLAPVHPKQVLTYLRLLKQPLGLLINFGSATFKEGIRRIVNHHSDFTSSRLRVHRSD